MAGLLDTNSMNPLSTTASKREVADEELTSYQTNKLLSKDSALRQTSEASGKNYATSRGLLNSDQGAQATFGAFVDRVTPIANADATAFGGVADKNMSAENDFKMADKNFEFKSLQQKDDQQWRSGENAADRSQQNSIQAGQQNWASAENTADRESNIELQNMRDKAAMDKLVLSTNAELKRLGYATELQTIADANRTGNQLLINTTAEIQKLNSDGEMNPETKRVAIQRAVDTHNASIDALAKSNNTSAYTMTTPGGTPTQINPSAKSPVAPIVGGTFMSGYAASMGYNATPAEIAQAEQIAKDSGMSPQQQREFIDRELAARGM